jgi:hypothetical protein
VFPYCDSLKQRVDGELLVLQTETTELGDEDFKKELRRIFETGDLGKATMCSLFVTWGGHSRLDISP